MKNIFLSKRIIQPSHQREGDRPHLNKLLFTKQFKAEDQSQ